MFIPIVPRAGASHLVLRVEAVFSSAGSRALPSYIPPSPRRAPLGGVAAASYLSMTLRVRLDFHKTFKLSELQQSWMAVTDDMQVIGDLCGHLVRTYSLRKQVRRPHHTALACHRLCSLRGPP